MKQSSLHDELYYIKHLGESENDYNDILRFVIRHRERGKGLETYLKYSSSFDEKEGLMRTYLVRSNATDELVGYFSLKAGFISINETPGNINAFDSEPGIELAALGINDAYISKHPSEKGCGEIIFRHFVKRVCKHASKIIGARCLYIFALPYEDLILRYHEKYRFNRLDPEDELAIHARIKPRFDKGCVFMYQII